MGLGVKGFKGLGFRVPLRVESLRVKEFRWGVWGLEGLGIERSFRFMRV